MKKIILLSGGFDSALMLADESNKDPKHEIYALSIDYGQRHYVELEYAEKLAEKYGVIKHNCPMTHFLQVKTRSIQAHLSYLIEMQSSWLSQ